MAGDWLGNDATAKSIEANLRAGFVRQHPSINASHEASAGATSCGSWVAAPVRSLPVSRNHASAPRAKTSAAPGSGEARWLWLSSGATNGNSPAFAGAHCASEASQGVGIRTARPVPRASKIREGDRS